MSLLATTAGRSRNKSMDLLRRIVAGVDPLLTAAGTEVGTMKLFTGITEEYTGSTFTPNTSMWAQSLRDQLTGVHMGAGGYTQSYGLQMVTPRHAISCAHNGPAGNTSTAIKYVKADGTVFSTTILKWICDDVAQSSKVSDTQQTKEADLSIYLLADEVPSWVYKSPIVNLSDRFLSDIGSDALIPALAISQGNASNGSTPDNRMAYVQDYRNGTPGTTLRDPFNHSPVTGDSGTPGFIVLDDVLYLSHLVSASPIRDNLDYLNAMIARADAAAGISTGYTVSALDIQTL